jgi:small subunit ribosomal protein S8e
MSCAQAVTKKVRILDVVYNASNNELVRTQTLVKNAIVQVDATPFKQWYKDHYKVELGSKSSVEGVVPKPEEIKVSRSGVHEASLLRKTSLVQELS